MLNFSLQDEHRSLSRDIISFRFNHANLRKQPRSLSKALTPKLIKKYPLGIISVPRVSLIPFACSSTYPLSRLLMLIFQSAELIRLSMDFNPRSLRPASLLVQSNRTMRRWGTCVLQHSAFCAKPKHETAEMNVEAEIWSRALWAILIVFEDWWLCSPFYGLWAHLHRIHSLSTNLFDGSYIKSNAHQSDRVSSTSRCNSNTNVFHPSIPLFRCERQYLCRPISSVTTHTALCKPHQTSKQYDPSWILDQNVHGNSFWLISYHVLTVFNVDKIKNLKTSFET